MQVISISIKAMVFISRVLALLFGIVASTGHSQYVSPRDQCANDLKFIPDYLIKNDAGGQDHWDRFGQLYFEQAMARATARLESVKAIWDCGDILSEYLRAWRRGHLWVEGVAKPANVRTETVTKKKADGGDLSLTSNDQPKLKRLSESTSLLAFPTFDGNKRRAIENAVLKTKFLAETPNWVIDLRANNGGSDSSWQALAAMISGRTIRIHSTMLLATKANREAWHKMCDVARGMDIAHCKAGVEGIVQKLSSAKEGTWTAMMPGSETYIEIDTNAAKLPAEFDKRPSRVAILVDKNCGSACEQFLLFAKQSPRVKLIGRPTVGALDYSNMIPVNLPSGNYLMFYAGTRSSRLPHFPVDTSGIQPDIYLDPPKTEAEREAEITFAQRFLETQ